MSYLMNVTSHLQKGCIDVMLNGEYVGNIEKWGITLENIPFELNDRFTIKATETNSSLCPNTITSTLGYNLSFSNKKELEWELTIIGPPPSPETDVNVTVGDDEQPTNQG